MMYEFSAKSEYGAKKSKACQNNQSGQKKLVLKLRGSFSPFDRFSLIAPQGEQALQ